MRVRPVLCMLLSDQTDLCYLKRSIAYWKDRNEHFRILETTHCDFSCSYRSLYLVHKHIATISQNVPTQKTKNILDHWMWTQRGIVLTELRNKYKNCKITFLCTRCFLSCYRAGSLFLNLLGDEIDPNFFSIDRLGFM